VSWGIAVVRGRSMEPTLRQGDRVLVAYGRQPHPGDLVVVQLPNRPGYSVKRVFRHDTDGWWVERDNPNEGVDSWLVGAIPDRDLLGVVRLRVWPPIRRRR
jgi:nickel-type superoxide dismutase maturation protease